MSPFSGSKADNLSSNGSIAEKSENVNINLNFSM